MKKLPFLILILLLLSILTPVFARNPAPIDEGTFFSSLSTEESNWNISENGSLQEEWSVLPSTDYNMWNRSNNTNQLNWWTGNDTIIFSDSDSDGEYSFLMANNSQSNRSQSLLWSYVNSTDMHSENVYVGPVFMNTTSNNATMVLYGNNSTYVFNRAFIGGKWGLYNTENFSYGAHGGEVIIPSDGIDYYNESLWGEMNLTNDGFYIKSIYNTYCGRIQSKAWNSNETEYTLMQEPVGWVIDKYFENATTDNATSFGVAVWNPLLSSINVSFDHINFWRLNYSLNQSDNISWDSETHPRPRMHFPVLNMLSVGNEWWDLMLPFFLSSVNITNDNYSSRMRNMTNNMSMESRPFNVNLWDDHNDKAQDDNVYYYSCILTNFTDWYLTNMDVFPAWMIPDIDSFSNSYMVFYIQQCEDGDTSCCDLGYDYSFISLDLDNNRQWDANDRAVALNTFGEVYSWTGNTMDNDIIRIMEGTFAYNEAHIVGFSWYEELNSPRNIHRYSRHIHTLALIPMWSLLKSDGSQITNSDVIGLNIATYNDCPEGFCIWENWNETNCSTFHNETDVDNIADLYWNGTRLTPEYFWLSFEGELGNCFDDCCNYCNKMYWKNYTAYLECFNECSQECLNNCENCSLNVDDACIAMWGEGVIACTPPINSTGGMFAVNLSIDLNISYFNETETGSPGDNRTINVTFDVCNEGDMSLTDLKLNLTFLDCSCSDWNFSYIDSNISITDITYYNESCYAIFNLSNMTGNTCLDYWININITECSDVVGDIWINASVNTSSGLGAEANDTTRLRWGIEGRYLQIRGTEDVVDVLEVSGTVLFFTGLCILISALMMLIFVVMQYGKI